MALTLDKLKAAVKSYQDKKSDNGDWPKVVFLPEGKHKVRFIYDKNEEVMAQYSSYGYFNRGIRDPYDSPKDLPEGFVNELDSIYKNTFAPAMKWSYGLKYNTLAYVYLYDTDSKSDNWQPGNLYVILGNNKFAESYINFLSTLAADAPEEIMKSLNPESDGVVLSLDFKFGKDGYCNIGATFPARREKAIDLTDQVWSSLETAYIKPGFNLEKYNALVAKYKEDAAKLSGATPAANKDEPAKVPEQPKGESMLKTPPQQVHVAEGSDQPPEPAVSTTPTPVSAGGSAPSDPWAKFRKQG